MLIAKQRRGGEVGRAGEQGPMVVSDLLFEPVDRLAHPVDPRRIEELAHADGSVAREGLDVRPLDAGCHVLADAPTR